MGVKMSEMAALTSPAGTEKLLALDSTTSKTATTAVMAAYTIDVLGAAAAATPTSGDDIVVFRSGTEKLLDLDATADYILSYAWSSATTVTPAVSGDLLLLNRSGTIYDINIDTIKTYALVGIQATVLDLSGLAAATLANTDLLAICQTSTAKKATIAALETLLWTDYATYVAGLTAVASAADSNKFYVLEGSTPKYVTATVLATYMSAEIISIGDIQDEVLDTLDTYLAALDAVVTPADADLLYCTQSGTAKKLSLSVLASYALEEAFELPWRLVDSSKYTALPASTSTLTMSDTSDFAVGLPTKYTYGGTTYYGLITAVSANTQITIAGATFNIASELTDLYVGSPDMVTQMDFLIDTAWGNAAQDIFSAVTYQRVKWGKSKAYLVSFAATSGVADTGASQPKLNVKVNSAAVSTNDSNKGITLSATPGTWTANSAIAISTSNYDINYGEAIDLRCTEAGTNGDADMLSVSLIFVSE